VPPPQATSARPAAGLEAPLPAPRRQGLVRSTIAEVLYRLAVVTSSWLPFRLAYASARRLGRLEYRVRRGEEPFLRPELIEGLALDAGEVERLSRRSCELSVCQDLEYCLYTRSRGRGLDRLIEVRGLEHLEAALAGGRGAILHSGHIRSDFTLFAALIARGHTINVVGIHPARCLRAARLGLCKRCSRRLEDRLGFRFLWMEADGFGVAARAANALRRNEIVVMEVDTPYVERETAEVSFFGVPTIFAAGHAVISELTGAPLLDFFVYRDESWVPQIGELGPPFMVVDGIQAAVQESATRLEAHARRYPAQVYWNA
jgi:Kdo2-lipid IVA lauroyltransferase/acyltransferase